MLFYSKMSDFKHERFFIGIYLLITWIFRNVLIKTSKKCKYNSEHIDLGDEAEKRTRQEKKSH